MIVLHKWWKKNMPVIKESFVDAIDRLIFLYNLCRRGKTYLNEWLSDLKPIPPADSDPAAWGIHGSFRSSRKPDVRRSMRSMDQSGSTGESVVYGSVMGSIFAGLPSLDTRVIAFDMKVID